MSSFLSIFKRVHLEKKSSLYFNISLNFYSLAHWSRTSAETLHRLPASSSFGGVHQSDVMGKLNVLGSRVGLWLGVQIKWLKGIIQCVLNCGCMIYWHTVSVGAKNQAENLTLTGKNMAASLEHKDLALCHFGHWKENMPNVFFLFTNSQQDNWKHSGNGAQVCKLTEPIQHCYFLCCSNYLPVHKYVFNVGIKLNFKIKIYNSYNKIKM